MDDFFREAKSKIKKMDFGDNKYEVYNFTKNPFPLNAGVSIGGNDKRENGSIYFDGSVIEQQNQFEEFLVPKPSRGNTKTIVFLLDYATSRGRGIGKTAFLNHQNKRINKDFGKELTDENYYIFSAYIAPVGDEIYNRFWKISKLIIESLIKQDIVAYALCRIRVFSDFIPKNVLDKAKSDNILDTLGNDTWLADNKVSVVKLNQKVQELIEDSGITDGFIEALAEYGSNSTNFKKKFYNEKSNYFWRNNANDFLFNDLILLFELAGFSKGILLMDEVEKIFPRLNKKDRRLFTDSIRYYFLNPGSENTKESFFGLLLTIHPYLQELMGPHWTATGLDRFAPISGNDSKDYTIYFPPIEDNDAIPLAVEYMQTFRVNDADTTNKLFPFDEEALKYALLKTGKIPGRFLAFLHKVIDKGIDNNWQNIKKEEIDNVLDIEVATESTIRDERLPEATTKL